MSRKGRVLGTNGTAQVAFGASGSGLLELFVKLCRGVTPESIEKDLDTLVATAVEQNDPLAVVDLFVLVFQTRDCRGGKGERALFRTLFVRLFEHFPEEVIGTVPLILEYGYFKDLAAIYDIANRKENPARFVPLTQELVRVYADSLKADVAKVAAAVASKTEPAGLTLAAKYAPRLVQKTQVQKQQTAAAVTSHYQDFGRAVRDAVVGVDPATGARPRNASEQYRKMVSGLNERLRTVELLMSAGRWDEIAPKNIPSLCLKRSRKAFLYEDKQGKVRDEANEARIALRAKLLNPAKAKDLKGGQLFANDIVRTCMRSVSEGEAAVFDAQWADIIRTVKRQIEEFAAQQAEGEGSAAASLDLGNLVPLVDVSGSMSGTPMEVAVAMGLIVSELTAPAFRGRVLTFESHPRWFKVEGANIAQKVRNLMSAPWGGSTNFRAALMRIIEVIEKLAVQSGVMPPVPDMIVFSDMQFDHAGNTRWESAFETVKKDWHALGERLRKKGVTGLQPGESLKPPLITFWNINSSTTGLVADADAKGVRLLSGFSQSLLKLLLSGALPGLPSDPAAVDPLQTLRAALDDERYDAVRVQLSRVTHGVLRDYEFVPRPKKEAGSETADGGAPKLPSAAGCGGGGA
eukprot:INCI3023.1.p1 GENE.INCI3023.1~~INCI3023.1.p1  ORF type:complete len:633 (+),score=118.54 INCI3023.1:150-2048(+)